MNPLPATAVKDAEGPTGVEKGAGVEKGVAVKEDAGTDAKTASGSDSE